MDSLEIRQQVIRRARFAQNMIALDDETVPPEGLMDGALTNGLAAIVWSVEPARLRNAKGFFLPARALLGVAAALGVQLDTTILMEVLDMTQPFRHGRADDETASPTRHHRDAVAALDDHPALGVIKRGRHASAPSTLIESLFRDAAEDATGLTWLSPKDRLDVPELEICDNCCRPTFLPVGSDPFGGTLTAGECIACGYERTETQAWDMAVDAALRGHRRD